MANTYKVTAPKAVLDVEPGDILEHDFSVEEEADLLSSGRLELEPRDYRVIGSSVVNGTKPGGTFKGAFTVGQEHALLDGGHIERVDSTKTKAKAGKPAVAAANDEPKES